MAIQRINMIQFSTLQAHALLVDVRSPGEYEHAHIPGAKNLPLFDDEERKKVGIAYKQKSREDAIKIGLDFYGVKMRQMVEEAEKLLTQHKQYLTDHHLPQQLITEINLVVHCWRGGMRSAGVAWLLDLYGFNVFVLEGGYKNYRAWARAHFSQSYTFHVLGGYTGSGKTAILQALQSKGKHTIDLEQLAAHKGSAFGALGQPKQPTQEMFENLVAEKLHRIKNNDADNNEIIWIEDESQRIGNLQIPMELWNSIRKSNVFFIEIPFEERLDYLARDYGIFDREQLINATLRIQKRLGGLETKNAINFLIEGNFKESFRILLRYYDVFYLKGLEKRENLNSLLKKIDAEKIIPDEIANKLIHENNAH
jgi:tRNA 2-selenouridine synthase